MKLQLTSKSRILAPGIILGTIISATIVLTASADLTNCAPAPPGLVSWWPGGGTGNDIAGTNNGTLEGGVTSTNGEVGQAFSLNGTNADVRVPASASLNVGLADGFTIETWINPADVSTQHPLVEWNSGSFGVHFWLAVATGGNDGGPGSLYANIRDTSLFGHVVASSAAVISTNTYQHVALTYDKSSGLAVLYANGAVLTGANLGTFTPMTGGDLYFGLRPFADGAGTRFVGLMDEVSLYRRALSASEISAIYNAGSAGKCGLAPGIVGPPTSQAVTVGANASFSVVANGTPPLAYQWQFNGTNVAGAATSTLTLTNVQVSDGGSYAVVVTNAYGTVTSTDATLTVNPVTPCAPAPLGLVGWWRGEGNCVDQAGGNNGVLQNGAAFAAGEVGQAFSFDGSSGYVKMAASASLNVGAGAGLTFECWIKPAALADQQAVAEWNSGAAAGLHLWLSVPPPFGGGSGSIYVNLIDTSGTFHTLTTGGGILNTNDFQHVALSYDKASGIASIYYNGELAATVTPGSFTPQTSVDLYLGERVSGDPFGAFQGLMDEASLYGRALSATEIAAIYAAGVSGKCALPPSAPYIYAQPANQVVTVGGSVTFSVGVAGTPPLSYQWSFGGAALDGATNASLTLTNVQTSQAGTYSVVITNVEGTASSSNATLSVNFPPALVRVVNVTNAHSGTTVNLPVSLAANGNENGLSFSLNFDTTKLTYVGIALGSGASGANLLTNAAQAASGKLGVMLALPPNQTFAAGTQEVVQVTFMSAVRTYAFSTTVSFGDVPIVRELSDAPGNVLAATYASGVVWIQAADFEGDLAPRPNGDKAVTVTDWVMAGRYAARLDYPTNAAEFQRADCAPRATLGDGAITVIDWVQVGLYAAHLDPLTAAGGPTNEVHLGGNVSEKDSTPRMPHGDSPLSRLLEVADTMVIQGLTGTASVRLESQGDENAVGFSLSFDPAAMNYVSASLGSASNGVTMFVNDTQAGVGRLGFVLGLGTRRSFVSGTRELIKVTFRAAAAAKGNCTVSFANQPVPCEVSGTNALPLAAGYVNGTITVNPLPSLSIGRSGEDITLAWPLWATNFGLQSAEGGLPPTVPWTNLVAVPTLTSNQAIVTLPLAATNKVYRLRQP